jgi:hypothetical protein
MGFRHRLDALHLLLERSLVTYFFRSEGRGPYKAYLETPSQVIVPGMKHLITLPGMPLRPVQLS